jgi:hypothetical protein
MQIMPDDMTVEGRLKAADALSRWFESQEMSVPQAVSVALALVAASFVEGANHGMNESKMRDDIIGLFDAFVLHLRQ